MNTTLSTIVSIEAMQALNAYSVKKKLSKAKTVDSALKAFCKHNKEVTNELTNEPKSELVKLPKKAPKKPNVDIPGVKMAREMGPPKAMGFVQLANANMAKNSD